MSFEPQRPVDSPLRANEVIAVHAHAVCAHLVINATVQVMPGQRLLTPVGFREAGTLGIGDRLVTAGGRLEVIDGIVTLTLPPGQPPVPIRNLTVANDRTWLAEGYRVHGE